MPGELGAIRRKVIWKPHEGPQTEFLSRGEDEVLYGECLSGALYWNDFLTIAREAGFEDPRLVEHRPLTIENPEIEATVAPIRFTSATYRQASRFRPELLERDPENRLLARGPRFRMDAEMVRDNALAVSGLLVDQIGGPSVKPYQPPGLWKAVGYTTSNTAVFKQDHGDALYRRSLYTFWKRTSPPPTMSLLDAPSRETCTSRRARTNTPLAALALMNDVQFFEAARHLAARIMTEAPDTTRGRIDFGFRLATGRHPTPPEADVLTRQYETQLALYQASPQAAREVMAVGDSSVDGALDPAQLAAWTMVANVILNLDETLTKP